MTSQDKNVNFWEQKILADYTNNIELEYNDPDKDYAWLDSDNYSFVTDNISEVPSTPSTIKSEVPSTPTDKIEVPSTSSTNNSDNGHEFTFDYAALQNAKMIINTSENITEDEITWEDINSTENNSNLTSNSDICENDYIIKEIFCENLVPCAIIDIFNGELKRCPNYEKPGHMLQTKKRRYLTNSEQEIFIRLKQLDDLSKEKMEEVLIEICTLPDTKPEDWD
ncbi:12991_t:CDS:2, partial [Ambispora gerdemannii]